MMIHCNFPKLCLFCLQTFINQELKCTLFDKLDLYFAITLSYNCLDLLLTSDFYLDSIFSILLKYSIKKYELYIKIKYH